MKSSHSAFTLVELSIVLVILGLLVGGVLTGQSLIRAAELRSITTQEARFVTAAQTFRDKYFGLPGDITNATAYWGIAGGSGADPTCYSTAGTGTQTCNGNGDGKVTWNPAVNPNSNEAFRFWQQLANAGLIEGSYDGITHGTYQGTSTTANSPVGRISSSMWWVNYIDPLSYSGPSDLLNGTYGNHLEIGAIRAEFDPANPLLRPEEAYNIDMKVDDGKPGQGKLIARGNPLPTCITGTNGNDTNADYLLTSKAIGCALIFLQAF